MDEVRPSPPVVLLSCHHCDFTCPGTLGDDVMEHEFSLSSPRCRGASMPSRCFCPGVLKKGCPCSRCHGHGFYNDTVIVNGCEDYLEKYCSCDDGHARRKADVP